MSSEYVNHTHCPICTKAYPTETEARECLHGHGELDTLRWVANCAHNMKIWSGDELKALDGELWASIDGITERFHIEDQNY